MTRQYKTQRSRYSFDSMNVGDKETFELDSHADVFRIRSAAHMVAGKRGWKFETSADKSFELIVTRIK